MREFIYASNGEPLVNERGEILLARAGEIVRCRDCKYYKPWVLSRPENGGDCVLNKVEVDVWFDGFCAWAERWES